MILSDRAFFLRSERESLIHYKGIVSSQHHDTFSVYIPDLDAFVQAKLSGKLRQEGKRLVAGDHVILHYDQMTRQGRIQELLPRRNLLSRVEAGSRGLSQPMVANIDYLLICTSLNEEFNLRRLDRYLAMAEGAGVEAVMVLTKADLSLHSADFLYQVKAQYQKYRFMVCSAKSGQGMESLKQLLSQDKVAALMGSSGVGKSSLINALIGEEKLRTSDTSHYKDKGRHTTTHRELIPLGAGAYLIDTPGMRELKLDESDADAAFDEIISLGSACRFRNCTHLKEPGCAVRDALAIGLIDADRFKSYLKLRREEQRPRRKPR